MRVFLIEPYYTGSHKAWADGWKASSRHDVHLLTMEGRFWKWRMHGGPVTLAHQALEIAAQAGRPDVIVASSMLDLATFLGLAGSQLGSPPSLLYMHENQLTYPLSPRTRGEDLSYGFVNWRSMVAADRILFNSRYHEDAFFGAVGPFLKNFPDYRQLHLIDRVRDKTAVIGVGIPIRTPGQTPSLPPLVLWNQRWEYDKDPIGMFEMLYAVDDQGMNFRLALTGENFRQTPTEFEVAKQHFGDRIIQFGYADAHRYDRLVSEADIVVSTANHEFFGVGVAEATAARAFPVLPRRLSYPELLPEQIHPACLYETADQAVALLAAALTNPQHRSTITDIAGPSLERFAWPIIGEAYDEVVDHLAGT